MTRRIARMFVLLLAVPSGAIAQLADAPTPPAPPVADSELSAMRGGLALPGGVDLKLAVVSSTAVDGKTVLQTVYRLADGPPSLQILSGEGGPLTAGGNVTVTRGASAFSSSKAGLSELALLPGQVVDTVGGRLRLDLSGNVSRVSLSSSGVDIVHLANGAFGTLAGNATDGTRVDSVTDLFIDLSNVSPDLIGSSMLQVDSLALDASRAGVR